MDNNSSLYESDFSDEVDYSGSSSETEAGKMKRLYDSNTSFSGRRRRKKKKILVSTSEEIPIEDESVILLDGNKNSRITLPVLADQEPKKTSKGNVFTGDSITIISKKDSFEHIINAFKGNYINGNSAVYRLKGGCTVVFHPVGNSWYADR